MARRVFRSFLLVLLLALFGVPGPACINYDAPVGFTWLCHTWYDEGCGQYWCSYCSCTANCVYCYLPGCNQCRCFCYYAEDGGGCGYIPECAEYGTCFEYCAW